MKVLKQQSCENWKRLCTVCECGVGGVLHKVRICKSWRSEGDMTFVRECNTKNSLPRSMHMYAYAYNLCMYACMCMYEMHAFILLYFYAAIIHNSTEKLHQFSQHRVTNKLFRTLVHGYWDHVYVSPPPTFAPANEVQAGSEQGKCVKILTCYCCKFI